VKDDAILRFVMQLYAF